MSRNFQGLRVDGDAVVGPDGARVLLRGVGLGGWMNMENFITGYPANESAMREAVAAVLGSEDFFDLLLDRFFGEADAQFLASLGVTCVRLPVNQRQFAREAGFARLERAVSVLGAAGIYSVIDLHAVVGCQNQHWHSDNPTHIAAFWLHPHFQDQVVQLWETLAERFAGNPWVAGYNLLNEPADPSGDVVGPFHDRLVAAIREIDPDHILFVDGNTYSTDFSAFGEPYENTIYACHDYAVDGMAFGGPYNGEPEPVEAKFLERTRYMRETGTPIWVGEFGPVYTGDDESRLQLLSDQLEIYERYGAGWSLWTYKDIGLQGLVYADPDGRLDAALRGVRGQEGAARRRLVGLDRPRAAGGDGAAARAGRARVPVLVAVPVERGGDDRRPRAPHPVRAGAAAGVRDAVPRALRRGSRGARGLVQPGELRPPRAPLRDHAGACATSSRAAR